MTTVAPLLAVLAERGHDFRDYRHDALARRVRERMDALGCDDLDAYTARVADDAAEAARLVDALAVSTSAFFRDPAAFQALARDVLPGLVAAAGERPLRAWVAGVATGEEAWTVAMLLDEACAPARRYEVFASDRNRAALAVAATGRYPAPRAAEIPGRYRERHVDVRDGHLELAAPLRERVRFCEHDLVGPALAPAEAVLARFDLVLCRNVLIYLEAPLQERLVDRLAAVLAPGGVLVVGPFEALPPAAARRFAPAGAHAFRRRP